MTTPYWNDQEHFILSTCITCGEFKNVSCVVPQIGGELLLSSIIHYQPRNIEEKSTIQIGNLLNCQVYVGTSLLWSGCETRYSQVELGIS